MQIVRTDTRPARIALLLSSDASTRVIRRAFRLVGGRWGGVYDVIVTVEPDGALSPFDRSLLIAADPDWILVIDPRLNSLPLGKIVEDLRLQPFEALRFAEGAERRTLRRLFVESPTVPFSGPSHEAVADYDRANLLWQDAAEHGLPLSHTSRARVPAVDGVQTPVQYAGRDLRSRAAREMWLVVGDDSPKLATRFWSLRALGRRPLWAGPAVLNEPSAPLLARQICLFAPDEPAAQVAQAASRWSSSHGILARVAPEAPDLSPVGAYFASHVQPAVDHAGLLRFSLPAPPVTDEPLQPFLIGVAEHQFQSPNPDSPDGLVLSPCERSRALLGQSAQSLSPFRVTRRGVAERHQLSSAGLVVVPDVGYRAAVAAPLEQAGFSVRASDKGRYQQRSLELAGGLRFLAWILRQCDSERLLGLFFVHHLGQVQKSDYRRAVTLADLREELHVALRERRSRLRRPLIDEADAWLEQWVDALLRRQLLVGGYVLRCSECAHRAWYRLDDVGQQFTCERCVTTTHVPAAAVRSFRLNEAFWQMLEHNGKVVSLLLASLRASANASLLYLPEVELSSSSTQTGEADVAALVDGALVLAEAKSNGDISKKEIGWYKTLAARTRASEIIFATNSRAQPDCADLACESCALAGDHHQDRAWTPGSQTRIADARANLSVRGISVRSACYRELVAAHADAGHELAPLEGTGQGHT